MSNFNFNFPTYIKIFRFILKKAHFNLNVTSTTSLKHSSQAAGSLSAMRLQENCFGREK